MELKHKRWNKWETKIYIVNAEERDRSEDIFTDIPIKISAQWWTLMMKMFCDFFLRSFIQFLHMCLLLLILFFVVIEAVDKCSFETSICYCMSFDHPFVKIAFFFPAKSYL